MAQLMTRLLKGAASGVAATLVMSVAMLGAKRLGLLGEPPPRRLTRRLLAPLGRFAPKGKALDATALLAHFGFGASMGGLFALLPPRLRGSRGGAWFGFTVWLVNYAGWLPRAQLMPRPGRDRVGRPTAMIAAHLVFGVTLAAVDRKLSLDLAALRDKVVVVCGGSRGLGRAITRELLRHGARVAICGRSPDALEEARSWLDGYGAPVMAEVCDLRNEQQTAKLFENVTRELGPIDVVVANAATIEVGPIEAFAPVDFDAAMRETFGTALRSVLAALPGMRARRRGTVAFISSIGGRVGVPHLAPYTAAKFAQAGFAEALHAEVAKDGIRVLTVFPGLMRTGSHLRAVFRGRQEAELGWFGASAIAPIVSIDADRAARHVVRAIARGDRFLTFTPAAHLGAWLHDVAPNAWSLVAATLGRLLPSAPPGSARLDAREGREGRVIAESSPSSLVDFIAARSSSLSARHGQR